MSHTILLLQPTDNIESRSWSDYENTTECLEGICRVYEEYLKKKVPAQNEITYDISHLFEFIDDLKDLSMLVLDNTTYTYVPHNKQYVKESIYKLMNNRLNNQH
ncbi:Enhancer of rudimentary homolog [Caenorhabditis elegans]|uniref:Enhancer of rudimentary homolog n=1 Tax=Caenorhabditis elegans TaxID=6239 RepID=ERH_CAEEL|nr:Enhancer of rudimentary homolog [Caenorhabditis elegans]Q22640.1 RecName: Full=Enhancer of rudimentary homolog [Caenorhabditis elegans]CAA97332.1 Enhancer of rudimentary homolog [Caenorhabditis elegans]|eukprot:NP_505713.1 Enhancer of rudimentary homolog [Caenorhabditis elegans]